MKLRKISKICYLISIASLFIGAIFHGYRMHPENIEKYRVGVTMGIVMISAFVSFLLIGLVLTWLAAKEPSPKK